MGLFDWLKFKKATAANPWKPGDRVVAKKMDSYFYPSVVRETNEVGCMVVFDDGEATWVHHAHVMIQDINIGSRVFCRGKNAPYFAPGTVNQRKGETILVTYDHGEEEWTSISMVRVQRPIAYVSPDALAAMGSAGQAIARSRRRDQGHQLARRRSWYWRAGSTSSGTRAPSSTWAPAASTSSSTTANSWSCKKSAS